jgi:hypothetical protein
MDGRGNGHGIRPIHPIKRGRLIGALASKVAYLSVVVPLRSSNKTDASKVGDTSQRSWTATMHGSRHPCARKMDVRDVLGVLGVACLDESVALQYTAELYIIE